MSIGAGGILGASLVLGLALGTTAAWAQTTGSWTDPPARNAPPQAVAPPAPAPVAPTKEPAPAASNGPVGQTAEGRIPAAKPERPARSVARPATAPRRLREAKRRPIIERTADRAVRPRFAAPRIVERRVAARPAPRRVVAHAFAPQPYPYGPLPVGRVEGPGNGERRPIFTEGNDRMRRIAAAQAAGYLVVRARTVQFPDGRMMRSYRPYDEDDGLD